MLFYIEHLKSPTSQAIQSIFIYTTSTTYSTYVVSTIWLVYLTDPHSTINNPNLLRFFPGHYQISANLIDWRRHRRVELIEADVVLPYFILCIKSYHIILLLMCNCNDKYHAYTCLCSLLQPITRISASTLSEVRTGHIKWCTTAAVQKSISYCTPKTDSPA